MNGELSELGTGLVMDILFENAVGGDLVGNQVVLWELDSARPDLLKQVLSLIGVKSRVISRTTNLAIDCLLRLLLIILSNLRQPKSLSGGRVDLDGRELLLFYWRLIPAVIGSFIGFQLGAYFIMEIINSQLSVSNLV
jgi:hypothetical protein